MNDLPAQIFMYLPFGVIFLIAFVCICRLHFDRKTDDGLEEEFEYLENLSKQLGEETTDCTRQAGEIEDGINKISERADSARKQIESASDTIEEARADNRTAAEAVARIEEILSEAKKI